MTREMTEGDRKRLLHTRSRIIELANILTYRGADLHDPRFPVEAASALREIARVAAAEAWQMDLLTDRPERAEEEARRRSEGAKSGWEVRRSKSARNGNEPD